MSTPTYEEVVRLADALTAQERLRLIAHLATTAQVDIAAPKPGRRWSDLAGTAPYPALGEDAQEWVSRTRQESDDAREAQQRDRP